MPPKGLSKFRKAKEHIKVAEGHYNKNENAQALAIINALMPQLRRWDDKSLLVEIHLLESKVYDAVHNLSKAKAALAASRTAANAVYVSPLQQAALDLQSGILGAEDKDFKTAFSYLYEAFEAYHQSATQGSTAAAHAETVAKSQELAQLALKYMLLCKIMANRADEVTQILAGKNAMKYQGRGVDAMRRVAKAFKARDLHEFKQVEAEYSDVFKADPLLNSQLDDLYEAMLEQHLLRTVEPYSQVQITHIASVVKLSPVDVERKLSQMILDKQLYGTIDQSNACLIVYDDDADEEAFEPALGTIEGMSKVIDALSENYTKAMAGDYDKKEDEKKSLKPEDVVKETGNAADDTHKKADADAVDPPKKGANDFTK